MVTGTRSFGHKTTLPLQALLVAPDPELRRAILSGEKQISIRQGFRSYRTGPVMLCCHLEPWCVEAEITDVKLCRLENVTDADIADEGCEDYAGLLALLQRFYPDINNYSPVTIIRFRNLTGKLAEQPPTQRLLNLQLAADIDEGRWADEGGRVD